MELSPEYRPPADVRRTGNRLNQQRSLYLRQHARNPVDWHPWDQAALDLARATDRPIFLSSGYASCHWCHVMEHEVFEVDAVAEVLNRHFVCIKVDREELPAVDAAYMEAVQLLTGGGGWPMSVFLTPDQRPFFGGTYFPRERFLGLLHRIEDLWRNRRAEVDRQAGEVSQRLVDEPGPAAATQAVPDLPDTDEVLRAVTTRAHAAYDEQHGGLTGPMKFPVPIRWTTLLHWWRRSGDPQVLAMVTGTLTAMAQGGLRDHVGGGFHRYTVDPHWTVPHFEKMLYDNAQLASLFFEAGAALQRPDFTAVGLDVLDFLQRDLGGDAGPCYASLDADSGGQEGTYYVWTPAQITAAVGVEDGPILAELLGVTEDGNFEDGTSVITRRQDPAAVAARHQREPAAVSDLFEQHRPTLRAVRSERPAPGLDRKIITAWNGLALSAFARGFRATRRADLLQTAARIAAGLRRVHRTPAGDLLRASNEGQAVGEAVLEDHALLAQGLLDLFQITGEASHLDWALELLRTIEQRFQRQQGGWYATPAAATPLGRRPDLFDSVLPSGSSAMVNALLTAAALTGDQSLRQTAREQIARQSPLVQRAGLEMAGWLTAALRLQGPLHEVVIAGDRDDPVREDLLAAAWSPLWPAAVVVPVPAAGAGETLLAIAPALAGKSVVDGKAAAYVCQAGACQDPVQSREALAAALAQGWRK